MGVVHGVGVIFKRTGNKRVSTPMCVYSFILGSVYLFNICNCSAKISTKNTINKDPSITSVAFVRGMIRYMIIFKETALCIVDIICTGPILYR